MKQCNKCLQLLSDCAFHKRTYKNGKVSLQPTCKECKKSITHHHYIKNKDRILEKSKQWRDDNPEKMKACRKLWWENNPKMKAYYQALHRARKENLLPPWITDEELEEIKIFYLKCPDGYQVDHIVPRHGKTAQGLHVLSNLQYLTPSENFSKSNKLTV